MPREMEHRRHNISDLPFFYTIGRPSPDWVLRLKGGGYVVTEFPNQSIFSWAWDIPHPKEIFRDRLQSLWRVTVAFFGL
jgi:hypothetical protein